MTRGARTPVVFTLEDLKEIYDEDAHGRKGMWGMHRSFHRGHEQCRAITVKNSDWIVAFLWNNFSKGNELLTGKTADYDDPIHPSDIDILKKNSDVVMVFTDDYHPYMPYKDFIYEVIENEFSKKELEEKGVTSSVGMWGSFVYSVAVRIMIHEIYDIKIDYNGSCGKESWRWAGYIPWCKERFGVYIDAAPPVCDELGNNYSTMKARMPKEFSSRINKKLMLPHFTSLKDVQDHIKDIKDLKAEYFSIDQGWVRARFYFNEDLWWTESIKLED